MNEHQVELQALIKRAAEGWYEHTAKDEEVLRNAQYDMVMWCATYLWQKGFGPAGAALLAVMPKDYAEKVMADLS